MGLGPSVGDDNLPTLTALGPSLGDEPASGVMRTFAIVTTDANELVADIHDRMPLILAPGDYVRWLGEQPDPR